MRLERVAIEQVNAGLQNQRENIRHLCTQAAVVATTSVLLAGNLQNFLGNISQFRAKNSLVSFTLPEFILDVSSSMALVLMLASVVLALRAVLLTPSWRFMLSSEFILDEIDRLDGIRRKRKTRYYSQRTAPAL